MGLGSCGLGVPESRRGVSRLNSQLSFTRQETLSQVAEENEDVVGGSSNNSMENGQRKSTHSYATGSFGVGTSWRDQDHNHHHNHNHDQSIAFSHMGSWHEDKNQPVMFSITPGKRAKNANGDIAGGLNAMETQLQFGMPQVALEMASMDRYMQIPEDSVPCKIRAKRGCATHPRSIAERERRTRISGKLKKLQDLVPNMDKQTSYADMLDLAVQHIKCLQDKVQVSEYL
nr:transcription factor bHLH128-like isoform X2 [Ipomoea batatas]